MNRLIILQAGQAIADIALESGKKYSIGRGSRCDVILPSEKGISREHLLVQEENGIWTMTLQSRYGDLVINGERMQKTHLQLGMQIVVSPFEIHFKESSEKAPLSQTDSQIALEDNAV